MRTRSPLALLILCVATLSAQGTVASELPEVLFIMDSSGSMSEESGGERKIDAARRVMKQVVPELPPEVRVGLIAYGHRRPGDCTDIEVLLPAGSTDRTALLAQVGRLEPRGKTPLSAAVLTAASMLKTKDAVTSIVLVSDGIETCGGDPCQVVQDLKQTGCKFVLHTVGFHVDDAAAQQLECMAGAGEGTYFAANDGDALLTALQDVSKEVAEKVEEAKVRSVTKKTGLGKLHITMPEASKECLAFLEIIRVRDAKVLKKVDRVEPDSTHPLLSGEYRVTVGFKSPNYQAPKRCVLGQVTIQRNQTRELALGSLAFNLPKNVVSHKDWKNRLHVDTVVITDAGTGEPVLRIGSQGHTYYNFKEKPLLPGVYDVHFKYGTNTEALTPVAQRVVVKPGHRSTMTLESGLQFGTTEGKLTAWRLYRSPDQTASSNEDGNQPAERELAFEARAFKGLGGSIDSHNLHYPYLLPEGTFDIEVEVHGMTEPLPVADGVKIKRGELLQFEVGL